MKEWAKRFYKSKAWKRCRADYIAKREAADGGLCEICKEAPGFIVHHKKELTPQNIDNPEVALNQENLEFVCKPCHDKEHDYCGQIKRRSRCTFDSAGNPVPKEPYPPIKAPGRGVKGPKSPGEESCVSRAKGV